MEGWRFFICPRKAQRPLAGGHRQGQGIKLIDAGQASETDISIMPHRYTKVKQPKPQSVGADVDATTKLATASDEICAGCWDYGDSFVVEYPFDDWTPVPLCRNCKNRSADYRQRDLIIRNAGRFMGTWDWRSVEVAL